MHLIFELYCEEGYLQVIFLKKKKLSKKIFKLYLHKFFQNNKYKENNFCNKSEEEKTNSLQQQIRNACLSLALSCSILFTPNPNTITSAAVPRDCTQIETSKSAR